MRIWYRLLIGQEASKRNMKHDDVSRYDKSQGWMGWERVHDMSWLPMNNDCMRSMHIVMSYRWGEAFLNHIDDWAFQYYMNLLLHWSYIIPKYVHFKGRVKMHILSANQRKAISSMGMESSFLQIRRDVEQPNVVYVRRNRHMRKLT